MGSYLYFDRLERLYLLEGFAENETPLRVGAGESDALGQVDNPVLTLMYGGRKVPVIPGSSWKGALRAEAERYVRSTPDIGAKKQWVNWRACDIFEVTDDPDKRGEEEENPCVVCSLFGNTGIASHLRFFDSYPEEGTYSLETITRVAIERSTGGQSPGKLFRVQVVPPGAIWRFRMTLLNVDLESGQDPASHLALYVIKKLLSGIQVGGGKSVGYGLIRLRDSGVKIKAIEVAAEGVAPRPVSLSDLPLPSEVI